MASEVQKTYHLFTSYGDSFFSGIDINKNLAKLCRDCGITEGKAVTSTDMDVVFGKMMREKNVQTIHWDQFHTAMKELGQKKFKGKNPDEALESTFTLMKDKGPIISGEIVNDLDLDLNPTSIP